MTPEIYWNGRKHARASSSVGLAALILWYFVATMRVDAFTRMSTIRIYGRKRTLEALPLPSSSSRSHAEKKNKNTKQNYFHKQESRDYPDRERLSASIALNKKIMLSESAADVLKIFVQEGGARNTKGNDLFNNVNFSTMMHRIAFKTQKNKTKVLSDPRLAILICAVAENMAEDLLLEKNKNAFFFFRGRELSNIAWAMAKLQYLVPPKQKMKVIRYNANESNCNEDDPYVSFTNQLDILSNNLSQTSAMLRKQVLQIAQNKADNTHSQKQHESSFSYMPTLRQLSGHILDAIAANVFFIPASATGEKDSFNSQEFANMLWAFATTKRGDLYLSEELVKRLMIRASADARNNRELASSSFSNMKPQEVSNTVWALATVGARGPQQIKFIQYSAKLLEEDLFLKAFKTQELANTAWGAATLLMNGVSTSNDDNFVGDDTETLVSTHQILRKVITVLKHSNTQFRAQEISIILWACATVKFGANTGDDDSLLMRETLLQVASSSVKRLREFSPQELNNLAWSYARLLQPISSFQVKDFAIQQAVTDLYRGIGNEILSRHKEFAPQDISTTLWSFATIGFSLEQSSTIDNDGERREMENLENIYKTAAHCVRLAAPDFKPQELSNSLWALATAGVIPAYLDYFDTTFNDNNDLSSLKDDPVTMCFGAVAKELIKRPFEFKEQEIKDIVWSFSKAGMRHPKLFQSVAEHLVGSAANEGTATAWRGLSTFTPQGFGNLAWSFAKQATIFSDTTATDTPTLSGNNGRLAVYETSCLDLGEALVTKLFASIAEECVRRDCGFTNFKPQDLSNVVWAFATLGLLHTSFLTAISEEVARRVASCPVPKHRNDMNINASNLVPIKPQEIANLLWSSATLNFRSSKLVNAMAPYVVSACRNRNGVVDERSIASLFNRQELANIAWSCAVLEEYPRDLLEVCYMGLLGDNRDPSYMRMVMNDLGLQKQAIRTLLYVQLALDLEAPHLHLSLPVNFPQGYGEISGTGGASKLSRNNKANVNSSLELNPSRTQFIIGRALQRIGFDHVQEFVLDPPPDFLSIDIANPEKKLGVEVDGPSHYANVLDDVLSNNSLIATNEGLPFDLPNTPRSSMVQINNRKRMQFRWEWHGRRHENGPTALKHRILCHLGWLIAHVPFWEWNCVAGNIEDENDYLREVIKEISDPDEGDE